MNTLSMLFTILLIISNAFSAKFKGRKLIENDELNLNQPNILIQQQTSFLELDKDVYVAVNLTEVAQDESSGNEEDDDDDSGRDMAPSKTRSMLGFVEVGKNAGISGSEDNNSHSFLQLQVPYEDLTPNPKVKLLDQVREVIRFRHMSIRTEHAYVHWIK